MGELLHIVRKFIPFLVQILGLVHTVLEEFEKGGFTLKTHQMLSVHKTPGEFENATIAVFFGFCV